MLPPHHSPRFGRLRTRLPVGRDEPTRIESSLRNVMRNRAPFHVFLLFLLCSWLEADTLRAAGGDTVAAWETNDFGQTNVPATAQGGVIAIAAGFYHGLALKRDGSVVAWGRDHWGQSTVPIEAQNGMVAIAGGRDHSLALKNDGGVVHWGTFVPPPPAGLKGVVAIAGGLYHSIALKRDGSVVG